MTKRLPLLATVVIHLNMKHGCSSVIIICSIILSLKLFVKDNIQAQPMQPRDLMLYPPKVAAIYPDSVYLEKINLSLPFNFDIYYQRLLEYGPEEMADEDFYFYTSILRNIPKAQALYELDRMAQIVKQRKSKSLEFKAEFWKTIYLNDEEGFALDEIIRRTQQLIDKADKRGAVGMKYKGLTYLMNRIWEDSNPDYSYFFRIALQVTEELEQNPDFKFPGRGTIFFLIGNAYYYFGEYDKAVYFLQTALSEHANNFYDRSNMQAMSTLAAYYYKIGQKDSADYYSYALLESKDVVWQRPVYDAIASANLGRSSVSREEYDRAIDLLKQALPAMTQVNDYSFVAGIYTDLADSYLGKGNSQQAKSMIDSVFYYFENHDISDSEYRWANLYPVLSRYYALTGNTILSQRYQDSAFVADKRLEEKFNSAYINTATQSLAEKENENIENTKQEQRQVLFSVLIFGGIAIVSLAGLLYVIRKRRNASHKRSEKERLLSNGSDELLLSDSDADSEDIMVFQSIKELIETEQIFRDPLLSPDGVAERIGISRKMVIKSINRMQQKSFAQYVNELRVQEAIVVLSNPDYLDQDYDEIALVCGFYDRKSFFRVFKKETGVSPIDFRKKRLAESIS